MIWLMEILTSCQEQFLKVLRDKAFNITKSLKYEGYQRGLASIVYKFLIKTPQVVLLKIKVCQTSN